MASALYTTNSQKLSSGKRCLYHPRIASCPAQPCCPRQAVRRRRAVRAAAAAAVRLAQAGDLPSLLELERLTADGASWSDAQIEAELTRQRSTVLVAEEGGQAVGWAVGWQVPDELHLMNVAVHPAHRRRGHARALLQDLIDRHRPSADSVLLEVRASNDPALALYSSLGFQQVGLRRRYYSNPEEDAVLMTLALRSGTS